MLGDLICAAAHRDVRRWNLNLLVVLGTGFSGYVWESELDAMLTDKMKAVKIQKTTKNINRAKTGENSDSFRWLNQSRETGDANTSTYLLRQPTQGIV